MGHFYNHGTGMLNPARARGRPRDRQTPEEMQMPDKHVKRPSISGNQETGKNSTDGYFSPSDWQAISQTTITWSLGRHRLPSFWSVARMSPSDAFSEDNLVIYSKCKHSVFGNSKSTSAHLFSRRLGIHARRLLSQGQSLFGYNSRNEAGLILPISSPATGGLQGILRLYPAILPVPPALHPLPPSPSILCF